VIYIAQYTSSKDQDTLSQVDGVATINSGIGSHSMVLAREWNTPYIAGLPGEIVGDAQKSLELVSDRPDGTGTDETTIKEGEVVAIDGVTGRLYVDPSVINRVLPEGDSLEGHLLPSEVSDLLNLADAEARAAGFSVSVNADLYVDADRALSQCAHLKGVGLVRTEGLFRRLETPEHVADLGARDSNDDRYVAALAALRKVMEEEFKRFFRAQPLAGKVVAVRLLDHLDLETSDGRPRIQLRGARIGMLRPEIYLEQVSALADAVVGAGRENLPHLEILVPYVMETEEFERIRGMIERVFEDTKTRRKDRIPMNWSYKIGCMIETPRAAYLAGELSRNAAFLSFGLNDFWETVFGIAKGEADDVIEAYLDEAILEENPATVLDAVGVVPLLELAWAQVQNGPNRNVRISTASEHAQNSKSVMLMCKHLHVREISVSPRQLPAGRLLAAQATLEGPISLISHPEFWG